MIFFLVGRAKVYVPNTWNDLTPKLIYQYHTVIAPLIKEASVIVNGKTTIGTDEQMHKIMGHLFVLLLQNDNNLVKALMRPQPLPTKSGQPALDDEGQPITYNCAHFLIYDQKLCDFFFKNDLVKNLVPKVGKLYGPADKFNNLRIEEYFFADKLFLQYLKNPSEKLLHQLIAVLYRPAKKSLNITAADYDGDPREQFSSYTIESRMNEVIKFSPAEKQAIVYWYQGCRERLVEKYPFLFTRTSKRSGPPLNDSEALIELCGGAYEFDRNKHQKLLIVYDDLQAKSKSLIKT